MLRYGTDIGTIETKQKKRKLKQNRRKRREKQNRRKDSERSKCCISCALRGGVQRGPIKGLDAAAQMRYTHTKGGVGILIENGFPLYLLPPSQHNTKRGKVLDITKGSSPVAGEPHASISSRSGSPVFECSSCSKSSVFRDSVRGYGPSSNEVSIIETYLCKTCLCFSLTRLLGIHKNIYTLQD